MSLDTIVLFFNTHETSNVPRYDCYIMSSFIALIFTWIYFSSSVIVIVIVIDIIIVIFIAIVIDIIIAILINRYYNCHH